MASITAANSVLMMSIPLLFATPQQIQGFATDDVFDTDSIKSVETLMGVDGVLSGGFVFVEVPQHYTLQADSASNSFFDVWWAQMQAAQDVYAANATIQLPGILTKFTMTRGFLTGYKPTPQVKRVLHPRAFTITWQSIVPQPI